jgi:DNA-binding winged helix-turn-helix (wHTH) protein
VQTHPGTVYQFGPLEVNVASGELLKNGRAIRVQEQPYRFLLVLLETPGEVVSREELRSRLWPDDTFVDFDGSLRVAVRKLREALDDNAEDPRYIETIPKRGYRFLVTEVHHSDPAAKIEAPRQGLAALHPAATSFNSSPSRKPLLYGIAAAAVLALAAGGTFLWHQRNQANPLTDKDELVLADFTNTTGESVFDDTLRQALAIQLEQSPFLKIMDDEQVQQTMRLMSLPPGTHVTNQTAHDICVRNAVAATIDGSRASLSHSRRSLVQRRSL